MQLSQIAAFSVVGLTLAKPVFKRNAAAVESDISAVESDLTSFDTSLNSFGGTITEAIGLLTAYNTLSSAITSLTSEVTSTGTLGSGDSATIYSAVETLTTQIGTTMSDADAKYNTFETAGYASYICSAISSLATVTDSFYTALDSTIGSAYTSEVKTLQSTAASAFTTTTSTYGC